MDKSLAYSCEVELAYLYTEIDKFLNKRDILDMEFSKILDRLTHLKRDTGLNNHRNIYDEFVLVVTTKKYASNNRAIAIEGFTAEKLNSDFPLSVIGAYNFLIYLRENPKEALEDLKKGLPRK